MAALAPRGHARAPTTMLRTNTPTTMPLESKLMEDQVPLRCPTFLPTLHAAEHARPSRIAPPADTGLRAHVCGGSARCKTWCPPFPPPPSPPSSDHAPGPARTNRRLLTASPAQQRCSSRCFGEGCCAGRLPAELLPDGIDAGAVAAREAAVRSNHSPDNPDPQGVQPRSGSDRHGRGFANHRTWGCSLSSPRSGLVGFSLFPLSRPFDRANTRTRSHTPEPEPPEFFTSTHYR